MEFSDMQKDAIGEILNISMGSAATAASELLNAKVWITTPRVSVVPAREVEYQKLEPAVCVKIEYVKGILGSNLMVLKQDDVQLILNQLMGQPLVVSPDFEFDELNISAVSEVMNQMMGSAATALSSFLGISIDISTPTPYIMDQTNELRMKEFDPDEDVVAVTFDLTIDGVIKSEFASIMELGLANEISKKMLSGSLAEEEPSPTQTTAPPASSPPQPAAPVQPAVPQAPPPMYQQPPEYGQNPYPQGYPQGYPQQPQYGYGYPPMGQNPYPQYGYPPQQVSPPINIQNAQLHQFESFDANLTGTQKDNLQLLMDVPLQISVEIGTARRKVKDILEFTQGTIIELERQAGAPVDVVVNGNLIARGDVVVIDDNFAVRITEIIKSKFIDSLGKE